MKPQLYNTSESAVSDGLQGLVAAHPGLILINKKNIIVDKNIFELRKSKNAPKVRIVSGGGSGHEPFCAGFVGRGMLSAGVCGQVFTSPSSQNIISAISAVDPKGGPESGVLVIVFNYTGDRLNFGLAVEKSKALGINVKMHISGDDSALTKIEGSAGRRGLCGTLFTIKIAGAMAEEGFTLNEILERCKKISLSCGTLGFAISGCTLPGSNQPLFVVEPNSFELGLGVHGEAGVQLIKAMTAKEIARYLVDYLTNEESETSISLSVGNKIALMVNNLGTTPILEIMTVVKELNEYLVSKGIVVSRIFMGTLMTSLDMSGVHISILKLDDDDWLKYLDAPTSAPAWPTPYTGLNSPDALFHFQNVQNEEKPMNGETILSDESASLLKKCLYFVAEDLPSYELTLNSLDSNCGDGDCGTTLKSGAEGLKKNLASMNFTTPIGVFNALSDIVSTEMGGTSGAIYSILFSSLSNALKEQRNYNQYQCWSFALKKSLQTVSEYGGAKQGDRTLLDAAYPSLTVLEHISAGNPDSKLSDLLFLMMSAADEGAKSTIKMKARAGRASYVRCGDVQSEDAGARGIYYIISALFKAVKDYDNQ